MNLEYLGISNKNFIVNASPKALVNKAIKDNEGVIGLNGSLMVDTGEFSGRIPNDKFIVDNPESSDKIWWGEVNQKISPENFEHLFHKVVSSYNTHENTFHVFEGSAGDSSRYNFRVRFLTKKAWQSLFVNNMFLRYRLDNELQNFEPDFTIINAFDVKETDWKKYGLNSENFIVFNIEKKIGIIGGTEYAGEMKKGIFSMLHYYLPQQGVFSMHCSANVSKKFDNTVIFFGLSGTGKTTLSTNMNRPLIGDDEHGWSNTGVYNFEGGCYAKAINLDKDKEPEIYNAIRFGTLLENVVYDPITYQVDFDDNSKSENSRVCYPIHYVDNSLASRGKRSFGPHPRSIIFLTCDAYGIMPPVSRLTKKQAMYHFISGYTAKMAGTETGVKEPKAAFSPCYGGPFLTLHPLKYAELLEKKMDEHNCNVYMVNTGWSGSSASSGSSRISLKDTRKIIDSIINESLDFSSPIKDDFFGFEIPKIEGFNEEFLVPSKAWNNVDEYHQVGSMLTKSFVKNFEKYNITDQEILNSGPSVK